ncbi:MAG TPA: malate synthase A, partial [Streptomyces sp.]
AKFILPDRNLVTMTAPFMRAYTELLVRTCHKRGAHAIGGMAAFIPSRRDAEVNKVAFEKVRADKDREANDGFDGSWVAHPDLVPIALESFDKVLGDKPNQKDRLREDVHVEAADLIAIDSLDAKPTYDGLVNAVQVGVRYIEAWLRGLGAVAIFNLMEDAATAEISRSQIWQWIDAGVEFENGQKATPELVREIAAGELAAIKAELGEDAFNSGHWQQAHDLLLQVALDDDYADFLTLPAYEQLKG